MILSTAAAAECKPPSAALPHKTTTGLCQNLVSFLCFQSLGKSMMPVEEIADLQPLESRASVLLPVDSSPAKLQEIPEERGSPHREFLWLPLLHLQIYMNAVRQSQDLQELHRTILGFNKIDSQIHKTEWEDFNGYLRDIDHTLTPTSTRCLYEIYKGCA